MYTINSEYTLVIKSVENDDNGEYFCRAQNSEGFTPSFEINIDCES